MTEPIRVLIADDHLLKGADQEQIRAATRAAANGEMVAGLGQKSRI